MSRASLFAGLVGRANRVGQQLAESYATANLTARVKITRPIDGWDFDPDTGRETPRPAQVVYPVGAEDGRARIYPVQGSAIQGVGDEPQYFDSSLISIPLQTTNTPRIDDIIEVIAHTDERLVGRVFRVTGHETGGQLPAVQRMSVTSIAPSRTWVQP